MIDPASPALQTADTPTRHPEQRAVAFVLTAPRLDQPASRSKPQPHADTQHQPFEHAHASHPLFQTLRTGCAQLAGHSNVAPPPRSLRVTAAHNSKTNSPSPPRDNYALRRANTR